MIILFVFWWLTADRKKEKKENIREKLCLDSAPFHANRFSARALLCFHLIAKENPQTRFFSFRYMLVLLFIAIRAATHNVFQIIKVRQLTGMLSQVETGTGMKVRIPRHLDPAHSKTYI